MYGADSPQARLLCDPDQRLDCQLRPVRVEHPFPMGERASPPRASPDAGLLVLHAPPASRKSSTRVAMRIDPLGTRAGMSQKGGFLPYKRLPGKVRKSARSGLTPNARSAPALRRSRAFPASAKSLRARARARRGRRRGGRSIGTAWRAKATARSPKLRAPCCFAMAIAVWNASSAGAGSRDRA